ncbi:DUF4331 domain-containing protein [Marinobacter sp. NSM]|uniref:DUF4331 domain-containing protein n=1 Tax=Marinobacter sp. NSM TaxID=3458004 RepID=UPI0040361B6F
MNTFIKRSGLAVAVAGLCLAAGTGYASSHREAPFITEMPKVDGTDFYMFRSYEAGREGFVTLIANYLPLQDAYGGPNYFDLDEDAIYEIHIDNTGNAREDITFRFSFQDVRQDLKIDVNGEMVSIPLKTGAPVGPGAMDDAMNGAIQVRQTYTVDVIRGDRRTGVSQAVTGDGGSPTFSKPLDNIGSKTIENYPAYAQSHVYTANIPGCGTGRVFAGQRAEAFAVNLGEVFDLINLSPEDVTGANGRDLGLNILEGKNVTSLALEVPIECVASANDPVIGAWTTASVRQARVINPRPVAFEEGDAGKGATVEGGAYTQVSRLGSPLVNEVVIGLRDKNLFNTSEPKDDASNFAPYVLTPTLPELIESLFGDPMANGGEGNLAPNQFPRVDLVWGFLNGVPGVTRPAGTPNLGEMLRLNTDIDAADSNVMSQKDLGVLGGDLAGFPNGRRPVDDVVDIALRVVMGALFDEAFNEVHPAFEQLMAGNAPARNTPFTDGAVVDRDLLLSGFPYLGHPVSGSPNPQRSQPE